MKSNISQISKRLDNVIEDMPLDKVRKLYYGVAYDFWHSLWMDLDIDTSNKKFDECMNILTNVKPNVGRQLVGEDIRALHILCSELRDEMDAINYKYKELLIKSQFMTYLNLLSNYAIQKQFRFILENDPKLAKEILNQRIQKTESNDFTDEKLIEIKNYLDMIVKNKEIYNEHKELFDGLRQLFNNYVEK